MLVLGLTDLTNNVTIIEIVKGDIWDTYANQTLNSDKLPLTQRSSSIRLSHFYHQFKNFSDNERSLL